MNQQLKHLIAQAEAKNAEARALLAKGETMTAEDVEKVKTLNAEVETMKGQIQSVKGVDELRQSVEANHAFLTQPATVPQGGKSAGMEMLGFQPSGYAQFGQEKGENVLYQEGEGLLSEKQLKAIRTPEYAAAFRTYLRTMAGQKGSMDSASWKVLQEGADTGGGFLVPEQVLNRLIQKKPTPTRVNEYVTTLTTSHDQLTIPKVNYVTDDLYTTGMRVTWTGEVPSSSTAHRVTEPVFGSARVPVFTAMMSLPLTNDLLEDSMFPLVGWASDKFAETNDLLLDNMILNGTGVGQPTGILSNPGGTGQPATINMGDPITGNGLLDVCWQLPEQYDDNGRWVMNKTNTGRYIAELKDSQGRYLWGDGYQDSGLAHGMQAPNSRSRVLAGYPVNWSGFMPDRATNAFPAIFGDFAGYYLVQRVGISVRLLTELYAETNQIILLGRLRFGGQVCEDWRIKIGKQA